MGAKAAAFCAGEMGKSETGRAGFPEAASPVANPLILIGLYQGLIKV